MSINSFDLKNELLTLTVFKSFLTTDVGNSLLMFLDAGEGENMSEKIRAYSDLASAIYKKGGDLGLIVRDFIRHDDILWFSGCSGDRTSDEINAAIDSDLFVLQNVAMLSPDDLAPEIQYPGELPRWKNTEINTEEVYTDLRDGLSTKGYGIFLDSIMFKVKDGIIHPVENADYQALDELYGYEEERALVLKNTEAFAEGKEASNVFLYGDAGTGKSTTVKACAAQFKDKGIRLIEFHKNQVHFIPEVAESLSLSPLKFIFFIDDLTFNEDDDIFYDLKGILEGNVSGTGKNILVYATSNRRHLIKESSSARQGDDLHLNDTLQETMSLSSRFGLIITFMKPNKDLYLSIVKGLAEDNGIPYDEDLITRAEAFAIRSNGRSPRTAKQFITLVKSGLK